eukprot:GFYU01001569.1.p2 GENE.GFYU01001569.1~~GFYU01001569.1.p2  ORF type:complete len:541 (+),score=169.96 GFYU01001569.1:168-1790(+)
MMSTRPSQRSTQSRRFKPGIQKDESHSKRLEQSVQIRKQKREESIMKKRREAAITSDAQPAGQMASQGEVNARLSNIDALVTQIMSNDPTQQYEATVAFRRLLSIERNPPIGRVIAAGNGCVVPRLIVFLETSSMPNLQFEAAWALTNIASGTSQDTQVVISAGAVPIFVNLLSAENEEVREQAVWALGNIAGDSPECREMVLCLNALPPLLQQLNDPNVRPSMLRNATWTLSNFCRGKNPPPNFDLVKPALPTLAQLIYSYDEEVLTDACWALSYLSDGPNEKIQAVIESTVCRRLVELMLHSTPAVQTPALRTVGNIVTGDDRQTQTIINCSALPALLALLNSPKKGIRKEACWTISNITAGNSEQIEQVFRANIIQPMIQLLSTSEFDIRKEACWAISNATSGGTPEQIRYLVQQGCIKPLCDLVTCPDSRVVSVALEGLENILKVGEADGKADGSGENKMISFIHDAEGIDKIEGLQHHDNRDIYEKAVQMMVKYIGVEDDQAAEVAPQASGDGGFAFGLQSQNSGTGFGGFNPPQ